MNKDSLAYQTIGCAIDVYKDLINFNVPNFSLGIGYERIRNLRYTHPIPEWLT